MHDHAVRLLTLERVLEASSGNLLGAHSNGTAGSARAISLIGGMPGAAFTSKWYRNPERLKSLYKRPTC